MVLVYLCKLISYYNDRIVKHVKKIIGVYKANFYVWLKMILVGSLIVCLANADLPLWNV